MMRIMETDWRKVKEKMYFGSMAWIASGFFFGQLVSAQGGWIALGGLVIGFGLWFWGKAELDEAVQRLGGLDKGYEERIAKLERRIYEMELPPEEHV